MQQTNLDEFDQKILACIKGHARMTFSDIGSRVGLSRVAVRKRMEMMEKNGVIKGYQTVTDLSVREGITFFLDIEAIPDKYEEVAGKLAANKLLKQIYTTTGDCRFHAVGTAPNQNTLAHWADHLYRSTPGVRKISWHTVLSVIKDEEKGVDYERDPENNSEGRE